MAYDFISHDLGVVRHMADEVLVMYLARAFETGPRAAVFEAPRHPYTEAQPSATPTVGQAARRQRIVLKGDLPSPLSPPTGCAFHARCPIAQPACSLQAPLLAQGGGRPGQAVACLLRYTGGSAPSAAGCASASALHGRGRLPPARAAGLRGTIQAADDCHLPDPVCPKPVSVIVPWQGSVPGANQGAAA